MKKRHHLNKTHLSRLLVAAILVLATLIQIVPFSNASAAQITARSLELRSGDAHGSVGSRVIDGGSTPGGVVRHRFTFTLPSSANLGSIKFTYCTLPGAETDACTKPAGLDVDAATLEVDTMGGSDSDFTMQTPAPSDDNVFYVTRSAASAGPNAAMVIGVNGVTNPSAVNTTFFVRISSYPTEDASGSSTDYGVVAASTGRDIVLTGTMPESLVFCAAETIGETAGVPDCAAKATDGTVSFDRLFSPSDTAFATSQLAASTNAGSGYAISVMGPTMTSGTNTVTAMSTGGTSAHGVSQFGLNLVQNYSGVEDPEIPTLGADITTPTGGTVYHGQPATNYDTTDNFRFVPTSNFVTGDETEISRYGETVANSNSLGTDAQVFTVSYIVNVPGSQPAGTYTTTLTYICTATY